MAHISSNLCSPWALKASEAACLGVHEQAHKLGRQSVYKPAPANQRKPAPTCADKKQGLRKTGSGLKRTPPLSPPKAHAAPLLIWLQIVPRQKSRTQGQGRD